METPKNQPQKKFKCEICEKTFSTNHIKNQHIRNAHGKVEIFTCNVCNKTFGKNHQLTLHQKYYHQEGPRPYKCDSCEKSFTLAGNLKKHILTHEGQRNYKCDSCEKSFTQGGSLKVHMKSIHKVEKNHKYEDTHQDNSRKTKKSQT